MKLLKTTTALGLVLCVTAGLNAQSINAPISEPPVRPADANTGLDVTPTGTPIVNIAAPDSNGVSYNRYNQFDVNTEGLIINNSRSVGLTVLGGQVLANPNLRNSNNANLILNEVVSSNRSDLFGPIEVFGPRAAFILANEAGITCDGCGFINISRVALSSGRITFGSSGEFTGFAVSGGDVRVEGDGLLAGNVDFFDIVTSAANFNASLYARDLVVAGGNGQYDYENRTATSSGDTARIAIDSSLLGGIFTNRIRLIGTSDGVGINLRGTLTVLEGPLEITSGGQIAVRSAVAAGDVTVRSLTNNINIEERLYGGGNVSLDAAGNINQSGAFLASGADISLQSGGNIRLSAEGLYAGLNSAGRLEQQGSIRIQAAGSVEASATQLLATGQNVIVANAINVDINSALSGGSVSLTATQNTDLAGQVETAGNLDLSAQAINLTGSAVGNGQLRITGDQIAIQGSAIGLLGAEIDAATRLNIDNGGSVQTNAGLNIRAGTVGNAGRLIGIGGLNLSASGNLDNDGAILSGQNIIVESGDQFTSGGVISANGSASINAANSASLAGNLASVGNLSVAAGDVILSGQLSGGGNVIVESRGNLNAAASAQIVTDGNVALTASNSLTSGALISARGRAELNAGRDSTIGGQVQAGGNIALTSNAAVITGQLVSDADIALSIRAAVDILGGLSANNALSINASDITLNNAARAVANNTIRLEARGRINNAGAFSGNNITVSARDFINSGTFFSGSNISVNAINLITQSGIIEGNGTFALTADVINLVGRSIGVGGVNLDARQIGFSLTNNLQSGGLLRIAAAQDLALRGSIFSVGAADIVTMGNLDQLANVNLGAVGQFTATGNILNLGSIAATDSISLLGNDISNRGLISANDALNLRSLSGSIVSSGDLSAGGGIELGAANLIDISGNVLSNGRIGLLTSRLLLDGTINAVGGLDAALLRQLSIGQTGSLLSGGAFVLNLNSLDNEGTLFAGSGLDLEVRSTFNNRGQIISDRGLSLDIKGDFTNNGLLQARDAIILSALGDGRLAGTIAAGHNLNITGGALLISGTLVADRALSLSADTIDVTSGGVVFGATGLNATSTGDFVANGLIASNGNTVVSSGGWLVQNGVLESAETLLVVGDNLSLNGEITALAALNVNATDRADITGNLSAGDSLSADAADLTLSETAQLASSGILSINALNRLTIDGSLSSVGRADLSSENITINNSALIAGDARIDITADRNVEYFGRLQVRGAAAISGQNIGISGEIASAGNITVSGDALQVAGQILSNQAIGLQGNSAAITGDLAGQGSINLNFINGLLIDTGASIASDQNVALASDNADIRGNITTLGQFSANIVQRLTISGAILSAADTLLTAGDLSVSGAIQANNDFIVNAGTNSVISGDIDAGRNLTVNAGRADISGNLAANGRLGLNAADIILSGSLAAGQIADITAASTLNINGNIIGNGIVNLSANDFTVNLTGRVEASQLLNINSGSANIAGLLRSGGNANVLVSNDLLISGRFEAAGDGRFSAGSLRTFAPSLLVANAALVLDVTNGAVLSGQISAGQINLLAGADIINNGAVFSAGDFSIDAVVFTNNAILAATGNVALNARDIRLGIANDLQSGGTLSLSSIDRLDLAGTILAVGNAAFNSAADILQNADINLGNDGSFTAAGLLTQNGAILSDGNVGLTAEQIIGTGDIATNGNLRLTANLVGVNYSGTLIALGNFDAISAGNLRLAGSVETNALAAFRANNILLDGELVALGGFSANSGAVLAIGSSGALRSGSELNLDLSSLTNAGLVTANADLTITAGSGLVSSGTIASSGNLALTSGALLTTSGVVQAGGNAVLNAATAANLGGVVAALGNVTANAGSFAITGSIESDQAITLNAIASIDVSSLAQIVAEGDLSLAGNGQITNAGLLASQQAFRLTSLGDIVSSGIAQSVGDQNWNGADINISGSVSSLAGLNITATNLLLNADVSAIAAIAITAANVRQTVPGSLVGGANLTVDAAQLVENLGAINADGVLVIDANLLTNSGDIASANNIIVRSASLQNAGLIEAGQGLDISGGTVNLSGDLLGLSGLQLSAVDVTGTALSRILSGGNSEINASGNILLASQIIANGAIDLTALGNITLSDDIVAGGTLNIVSDGLFNLTGYAEVVDSLTISADELDLTGNILTNADLNLRALNGSIDIGGDVVAEQTAIFNATGTINLAGNLQSDNSVVITSDGIAVSGSIVALSQITLNANEAILAVIGSSLHSNEDIIFNAASFDIDGLLESNANISLQGAGNSRVSGNLLSGGAVQITAADFLLTGDIQAANALILDIIGNFNATSDGRLLTARDLSLRANGNVVNAGVFSSNHQIRIVSGGDLDIAGTLQAGQGLALNASNIAITGIAASNAGLDVNTLGNLNVTGRLTSLGASYVSVGSLNVETIVGQNEAVLYTAGDVSISAVSDIINSGLIGSDNTLNLAFGGIFDNRGSLALGGDFTVTTANDLALNGDIFAGGAITLATRDLDIVGILVGERGFSASGRTITIAASGAVQSGTTLSVTASDALNIAGGILALGNLDLNGGNEISLLAAGVVESAGNQTLSSSGVINSALGSNFNAQGSLTLNGAAATLAGDLLSNAVLRFSFSGDIALSGAVSSNNSIEADFNDLTQSGRLISEGDIRFGGRNLSVSGDISASLAVSAALTGNFALAGSGSLLSGGPVSISAVEQVIAGEIESNNNIALTAQNAFVLNLDGEITTIADLTLSSNGRLDIAGNISTERAIVVTGGATNISGLVETDEVLTIGAGALAVSGRLSGAGGLTLNARSIDAAATAVIVSDNQITLTSAAEATLAGLVTSDGDVTVNALGNLNLTGNIESEAAVALSAGQVTQASAGAIFADKTASINASGAVYLAGLLSSVGAINIVGDDITTSGNLFSEANILLSGFNNLSISGTVSSNGSIDLIRSGNFTQSAGLISAGGALSLSNGLSTSIAGIAQSTGTLTLRGGQTDLLGIVLTEDVLTVTTGSLDIAGQLSARQAVLNASVGGINLTAGSSLTTGQNSILSAQNAVTVGGVIVTGVDTATGNGTALISNLGDVSLGSAARVASTGNVTVLAQGSFNSLASGLDSIGNERGIEAGGNVGITAASGLITSGQILADGAIAIAANGEITVNAEVNALNAISVVANAGAINIVSTGALRSEAVGITANASGNLINAGDIAAANGVSLTSGTLITSSGDIYAADGILSLNAGRLQLGGSLYSEGTAGQLALNSNNIEILGNVSNNAALIINRPSAQLSIAVGGLLQSNAGIDLDILSFDIAGTLRALAPSDIDVTAGLLQDAGRIEVGGTLDINSVNALTLSGNVVATNSILIGASQLTQTGIVSATTGAIGLASTGQAVINGLVDSAGALSVSGTMVTFGAASRLNVLSSLTINASNTITANGIIGAGGAITLSGTNGVNIGNELIGNSDVTITANNGAAILSGYLSSVGNIAITADSFSVSNIITANGNVTISTDVGNIAINDNVTAGADGIGQLVLTASAGDISLSAGRSIFGQNGVAITGRSVSLSGAVDSPEVVTVNATNGGIAVHGSINSDSTVRLTTDLGAGQNISIGGRIDGTDIGLSAYDLSLGDAAIVRATAGATLSVVNNAFFAGDLIANGSILFNNASGGNANLNIAGTGSLQSLAGAISLNRIANLNVDGLVSGQSSVSVNYANSLTIGSSGRIEAISFDGSGNVNGGDISLTYLGGAGGNSDFTTNINGELVASRDITLTGGASSINGLVNAGRNLNISSDNFILGSLDFNGIFGNRTINGIPISVLIGSNGFVASGGNSDIDVAGALVINGPGANGGYFYAAGNANLNAFSHYIAGDIYAAGTLSFANGSEFIQPDEELPGFYLSGSAQSAGALTIASTIGTNGTRGGFAEIASGGQLISDSSVTIGANSIFGHGTIAAGDLIALNAGHNIVISGLLQSDRRIAANAGSDIFILSEATVETLENAQPITIGRDQNAGANISLSGVRGVSNQGTIYSDGSIAIRANGTVSNSAGGNITALGGIVLQSNLADIHNEGAISADSLALYQAINFNNSGSFVANGSLLVDAPNISNSGLIGAGFDLTLNGAGSIINTGTLFAGDSLTAVAGTRIHNDEGLILAAFGSINLTAPELLNESSRIEALNGNVTINSANIINRIKNLIITRGSGGDLPGFYNFDNSGNRLFGPVEFSDFDCGNGSLVCLGSQFTVSQAFISMFTGFGYSTGTYIFFDGSAGGDDTVSINSGASQIVAADDVIINGGATGMLLNSNSSILAGNNITITTGTVNNVADLVRTTGVELLPTGRRIERFEDANLDCGQVAANSGARFVSGSCQSQMFPNIGTSWQEFEFSQQTVISEVALPTVIQAGGTVTINAARLGNGSVVQNVNVTSGSNPNPNTNVTSANAQGNRDGFDAQPDNVAAGEATDLSSANVGGRGQAASGIFTVDTVVDNAAREFVQSNGNGAGAVATGVNGFAAGGNMLNNNAGGANVVSAVTATISAAPDTNVGGLAVNNSITGDLGANVAASGSITLQTANGDSANGGNANRIATLANADSTLAGVIVPALQSQSIVIGNDSTSVSTRTIEIRAVAAPAAGADAATAGPVNNAVAAVVAGTGGVTVAADGAPVTLAPTTINLEQDLGIVAAVNITDTAVEGDEAQDAVLANGFNGIAIQGIIGADGNAGSFILGFLRQFDLVNRDGGFDFANGNSLFTFNDSPDARFLFTTNRGFGDLGSLFDSDFFFDQLERDRETFFLRLGDGFFETQLISQQVRAATNQAQLPQFGSALEQAEGLLQSAVAQQRSLGLTLGVALTSDQVAQLTTSLVWWVSAEVAGRTALVPVLYLAAADQKEIQNGSIIAGTNVVARVVGDIRNTGTISASRVVSLASGNDIVNSNGGVVRGGTVIASAARDIINSGPSTIAGGDVLLAAGRDVSIIPVTNTASETSFARVGKRGFTSSSNTTTNVTGGTVAVDNNLIINAGRDVTIGSSTVSAGGDAEINAGRNVAITGESETSTSTEVWDIGKKRTGKRSNNGSTTTSSSDLVGSSVAVAGNLVISAGNNVAITGSDVTAGGNLGVTAGNAVTIEAGQSTSQTDARAQVKKRSSQSSATTLTNELSNVGAGGNLVITTPGTVTVAGANLAAGGTAAIVAGTVNVTGVVDVATENSTSSTKKSGFLSSKRTTVTTSSVDQTVVGSSIVAGNNIAINSAGSVNIAGSVLSSGNDTTIVAAGPVGITSLVENDSNSTETVVKKRSLLGAIVGIVNPLSGLSGNNGRSGSTTSESQSSQTNVLSSINAGGDLTISSTGDAVRIAGATLNGDGAVNIVGQGVTVTGVIDTNDYSYSSNSKRSGIFSTTRRTTTQDATTETAVVSTVSGDTVNIDSIRNPITGAGGNLDIIGSNVVGTGNVNLNADGDINIGTLETTSTESSLDRVKRSGLSIDFRNLTAFAGVSNNRVTNDATITSNTGSLVGSSEGNVTVNAGRDLTVTGSTITSPGTTLLTGENVTIQNATDQTDTLGTTRSSSIGITAQVSVPLLPAINGVINSARIATGPADDRTRAVAGVAGALAVANAVYAAPKAFNAVRDTIKSGDPKDLLDAVSVSVTAGVSSSRSRTETTDQTVVGSSISGGDVVIAARGNENGPASGTINITGSIVNAGRDLTLAAPGAITIAAATETDTLTSSNRSSGFSAGASIGSSGLTPTASASFGRGNSSGRDVTNIESIVSAGGTARVTTPGAFTIDGSQLNANRVEATVGALTIESQQDTLDFRSRQSNVGLSASLAPDLSSGSGTANVSSSRESERFVSVETQAGINAGDGGFNIDVQGATALTGAVISSAAAPENNQLTTGTLSSSDLQNSERYRASQVTFGAGISGIGAGGSDSGANEASSGANAGTNTGSVAGSNSNVGRDNNNNVTTTPAPGSILPGINVAGLGTLSPTLPVVQGASGNQSGTTNSAIAQGTIIIRPGEGGAADAASQAVANTISRDTAAANAGALSQEFDAARRDEVAQGFEAARELAAQTQVVFANAAREQARERETLADLGVRNADGSYYARPDLNEDEVRAFDAAQTEYARLDSTFGATSPLRIFATALNGAAGGNAAGGLGDLARAAAANVLQSLAVNEIGQLADRLRTPTLNADGTEITYSANATSESVRALLQGLAGCAGQAIGGGDCGSGALGGAGSVAANLLLNALSGRGNNETVAITRDANGNIITPENPVNPRSLEEQQAQTALVATLLGTIASAAGLNVNSAVTAGVIETENNQISNPNNTRTVRGLCIEEGGRPCTPAEAKRRDDEHFASDEGRLQIAVYGSRETAQACINNSNAEGCAEGQARLNSLTEQTRDSGISFSAAADSARTGALNEIHRNGPVSAEAVEAISIASELGLGAGELRALAALPGGQLSSQVLPELRILVGNARRNPFAAIGVSLAAVGLITYAVNNPVPDPLTVPPVIPPPPGFTPAPEDVRGPQINSTPNNGPIVAPPLVTPIPDPSVINPPPLVTPNNGPIVTPPLVTPIPTPAGPSILMNEASGGTPSGAANVAAGARLPEQLRQENLANIAAQDARLAAALRGSGTSNPNFGIGSGTASEADRLGQIFVGDGARATSGGGLISADGTRAYRPASLKRPSQFNPTGRQANFETYTVNPINGDRVLIQNGHLVITK